MIRVSRGAISLIAGLFGLYYAVLGAFWVAKYQEPIVGVLAILLYSAAMLVTVGLYKGVRMPVIQAFINLSVAVYPPLLVNPIIQGENHNTFATWYIGALGALLAATAVRGHRAIAWIAAATVAVEVVVWGGAEAVYDLGLVGMLLLVAAGQAISLGLDRASLEAKTLSDQALADAAATAATSVQRLERKERAQRALESSLPMLQRIVVSGGSLTENERVEARLAEASLRDEIRGRELVNERVREAVRLARIRGVEVVMLDEGGLDSADSELRANILDDVAATLDGLSFGKVTVRAPANEAWMVTIAATAPGSAGPVLWLKLP
jgi:uncharacterized membrane protein